MRVKMFKTFFWLFIFVWWTSIAFAMGGTPEKPASPESKETEVPQTFDEYLAQKETPPQKEIPENELLAPVAKPVIEVMEGVQTAVEPLLEEKEIKDEKGETKVKIKPKEGRVEVPF